MIELCFSNGKAFLWNADDIYLLRKDHRIVGALVGSYPNKPFQMHNKWLPLQLMPEETKLLIEKGIARLVQSPQNGPDPETLDSFYQLREKLCEEQIILMKENRQKTILEKADEIFEGKKRKLLELREGKTKSKKSVGHSETSESVSEEMEVSKIQEEIESTSEGTSESSLSLKGDTSDIILDKDTIIQAELSKVSEISKDQCMVQLFAECPWKKNMMLEEVNWRYPNTEEEKLRFAVFKDLWERGLYITSGCKFGGDFLAYEGDPFKYHALYIVVCIEQTSKFQAIDILTYGRLGNQVKKTVALASVNSSGIVEYISLKWEPDMR
ncbi:tRNA-splicing endonuclease subunit Sen34-like [Uloborus diversus]|uniref:tRNA-splicing endonuclease subunit Sen34-like n=1 Tax=Uloborus diversus TaxID=327109 RepID=UPI0024090434|nr:tRNA-splicing endonuclease subunit Sen34-like [Uloborus diversus]